MNYIIRETSFFNHGVQCHARLYMPPEKWANNNSSRQRYPVIIMAHGFGARMDFGLHTFAERFVNMGFAIFMFDYRGFGESRGTPRNLVSPRRHLADWHAAIAHVRTITYIDTTRIFIWGTSFSGGHVLAVAANDNNLAGVIAQVPFVDGPATVRKLGLNFALKGTLAGLRDLFRMVTFRKPYTIPIVAEPGTFAAMNTPESLPGYMRLVPDDAEYQNACPARICLTLPLYRPAAKAHRISCPVLVIAARNDSLIDIKVVKQKTARIPKSRIEVLECGHFDPYVEPIVHENIDIQEQFLKYLILL